MYDVLEHRFVKIEGLGKIQVTEYIFGRLVYRKTIVNFFHNTRYLHDISK